MNIAFAPMEGITGYVYRNAHKHFFPGTDRYFSPFLVPTQNRRFTSREKNDILPEHNQSLTLIPQILTNDAENFIWAAGELKAMGYHHVNLNLGCPSGTVVSKGRGAGFLEDPQKLKRFLDKIFENSQVEISIKTRIGKEDPDEFYRLIEIFNQYPLKELIIHPRIQKDFYKNTPNWDMFEFGQRESRNPVCYNGNLFARKDWEELKKKFPQTDHIMLGRGLVANPALADIIKGGKALTPETLKAFHDEICHGYENVIPGDKNVLFKMKELWFYLGFLFRESENLKKKIRKTQKLSEYRALVNQIFQQCPMDPEGSYFPQL